MFQLQFVEYEIEIALFRQGERTAALLNYLVVSSSSNMCMFSYESISGDKLNKELTD